jgi:hypothetical protein
MAFLKVMDYQNWYQWESIIFLEKDHFFYYLSPYRSPPDRQLGFGRWFRGDLNIRYDSGSGFRGFRFEVEPHRALIAFENLSRPCRLKRQPSGGLPAIIALKSR